MKMTYTTRIFPVMILSGATLLSACATRTNVQPTASSRSFSPVCSEGVAVYDDFTSVPFDYYEVAYITAEQNSVYTDKGQMVTAMRKRAGEQGGNALVVNSVSNSKSSVKLLGAALGANSADRQGKAVAIYMPSDTMRVKNACGKV
jgi:hypothetical protein